MKEKPDHLTVKEVRSLLDYCGETGNLYWRVTKNRKTKVGHLAGSRRIDGYVAVKINGHNYLAHRLAWAWVHGEWPQEIDHRDTDPSNNRLSNLRPATRSQNKGNVRAYSNNTSGFKGVCYARREKDKSRPWRAQIKINGKLKNLGSFKTAKEAHAAYAAAAGSIFGEFARAA